MYGIAGVFGLWLWSIATFFFGAMWATDQAQRRDAAPSEGEKK